MKHPLVALAAVFALAISALPFAYGAAHPKDLPSPHVKVLVADGHGSAVHIGHGLYLTAAHVVAEATDTLIVQREDRSTKPATVLWSSSVYDLALIRIADPDWTATLPINCEMAPAGLHITAYGNPKELSFLRAEGYVAGGEMSADRWASALPIDMTVLPGMSGGGVLDDSGRLVGIAVGVLGGGGPFPSFTGFGLMVPTSAVCQVLGRT